MTPTKTRKAVTPPTSTKVEAKAPVVEQKFTTQFTNRKQDFKPRIYHLKYYSKKIIRIINNPFIKKDPEAILFYVKDYCENSLRICIEEKTKAHTELSALKKMKTRPQPEQSPTQTQQEFNAFDL